MTCLGLGLSPALEMSQNHGYYAQNGLNQLFNVQNKMKQNGKDFNFKTF